MSLSWTFSNYDDLYGPEFEPDDLSVQFNFSIDDVDFHVESNDFTIKYLNEGSSFEHIHILILCGDNEKSTFHLCIGSDIITIWHEIGMTEFHFSISLDYDIYEKLKKSIHDLDKEYYIMTSSPD